MKRKTKRKIIVIITLFIFSFFLINSILFIDENNLIKINSFKKISSIFNNYIIKKIYKVEKISNDVLNIQINYLNKENNELKKLLGIKKNNNNYMPSYITNQTSKMWFNSVYIKTDKKLKKHNPVINGNGLIGFVEESSNDVARVNLINNVNENSNFSVLINTHDDKILGILCDYDKKRNLFKIKDVIDNNTIKEGDKVVLKGNEDIYVGDVVEIKNDNDGLSKIVWLKSKVNFDNLLYVLVVEK